MAGCSGVQARRLILGGRRESRALPRWLRKPRDRGVEYTEPGSKARGLISGGDSTLTYVKYTRTNAANPIPHHGEHR